MVYIYGGAFTVGEATRELYGPDYFMTKDVVVVTLNYRLDCFGESTLLGLISYLQTLQRGVIVALSFANFRVQVQNIIINQILISGL